MKRPVIICHMITSLDGRLKPGRWPFSIEAIMTVYDRAAEQLDADGWIVGRQTMADYIPSGKAAAKQASQQAPRSREDRICGKPGTQIAICFDRQGCLRPEKGEMEGDHLVLALPECVSDAHVDDLVARGVSVVFAGPDGGDLSGALTRIGAAFGAERLLLEGGGRINGVFLAADLIDETSTLVLPVIDGLQGSPAIYGQTAEDPARRLELMSSETLEDGTVWMRHRMVRNQVSES